MANTHGTSKKALSLFSLVMINVIAVDSLKTLAIAGNYGLSLLFYYALAGLVFFVPTALITAELATAWPEKGGLYIWTKEAFGSKYGFLVVWLQWIYNIIWYPTMLTFVAGTFSYLIDPALTQNSTYMMGMVLLIFWLCTFANFWGMKASSMISTIGSLLGTLFPMFLIIGLGCVWLLAGEPSAIEFSRDALFPDFDHIHDLVLASAIVFALVGLEMSAVHANEVEKPESDYPKALMISVVIILLTLSLSSLAVAVVVPKEELDIVDGLIKAFDKFFIAFDMKWMTPVMAGVMVIGGVGSVATWIIGPTKGLLVAAEDGLTPEIFSKTNEQGVPTTILWWQAGICTILSGAYIFFPSVHSAYWALTALTAQLALIAYLLFFAAALYLRYKHPNKHRPFKIPGGNWGMWLVCLTGMTSCIIVFFLFFLPPTNMHMGVPWLYQVILLTSILIICVPPLFLKPGTHFKGKLRHDA